jgi:type IV pilus assembly protein PilA
MLRKLHTHIGEGQRGFSLIEILVVILIIGVLAAIALPAFLGQRSKGQDSSAKSAARNLVSAIESFYATNKTYTGAASDDDITKSGVYGTDAGEADIVSSSDAGFRIVGLSESGNRFTITKSSGSVTRTCTTTNSGACPSSGSW